MSTRALWVAVVMMVTAVAAVVAGCATLVPKIAAPDVTVSAIRFDGGNVQQQRLQLSLHVTNPNDRRVSVRSLEADLDLADMPFAHGVSDAAFTLPAHGQTDFVLNVTTNLGNALAALAASMGHGAVAYHVHGRVRLQQGLVRSLPFDHHGRVRISGGRLRL